MRTTLILIPAVVILCAAASTNDYRSLRDEAPPTRLPVPVVGVRPSQLRDTWGAPRSGGRAHEGIDIPARRGTPVLSTTHGIVSAIQSRDLGGNTVSVIGPGGHSHYYAHLDSYGRYAVGDRVNAGDTIGFVGNTGNAQGTSPHLHYGIYTDDGPINPYPLLTGKKGTDETTMKENVPGTSKERSSDARVPKEKKEKKAKKEKKNGKEKNVKKRGANGEANEPGVSTTRSRRGGWKGQGGRSAEEAEENRPAVSRVRR